MKRRMVELGSLLSILFTITGCASIPDIVPQIPLPSVDNNAIPAGQDVEQANALLAAGKQREAANAYFNASNNYNSPDKERLILQASELAALLKDLNLTQSYLASINYATLNPENQARYRLTQAQLALNDRNFRETLRILPQRVFDLPADLGEKILGMRMSAAQSNGDKLALVQELVLQEPNLKEDYQVSLNHDRIWNHVQQIPAFQLEEGKNRISHPTLKNWLILGQFARVAKAGTTSKKESLRSDIALWIQNNPSHPGQSKAITLLNSAPSTVVSPYRVLGGIKPEKPIENTEIKPTENTPETIAILLPLSGNLSGVGQTILDGIKAAHKQDPKDYILQDYDTSSVPINSIYTSAVENGASKVIGPFRKSTLEQLTQITVPTVGLNYIQEKQSPANNFFQFGLSPEDEAIQVVQYALNQGQKRVAILTPDSSWGDRLQVAIQKAVNDRLGQVVLTESYRDNSISYLQPAQNVAARVNDIDAVLIAASPTQARRLYPDLRQQIKALPIYATSHVFSGLADTQSDAVLEGLLFTETPWVLDNPESSSSFPRLFAMGMDAYQIATQINDLKSFGNALNGKTGRIRLSSDGSLHRNLTWARFSKGRAIVHGR